MRNSTHTASFLGPLPLSLVRRFLRQISSNFSSPFHPMSKLNHPVMAPLADTFQDKEQYVMVGSNPVPMHHKNMKIRSIPFSTSCKRSSDKHPELVSRTDHFPSKQNTTVSESRESRRKKRIDLGSAHSHRDDSTFSHNVSLPAAKCTSRHDESLRHSHFGKTKAASAYKPHNRHNNFNRAVSLPKLKPYDICFHGNWSLALTGDAPHEQDKGSYTELQEEGAKERILRPGMVLLKHYITHDEQVEIVKTCRKLGLGPGGFYQPGYADGAKLRLQMMCLGLDWDPQTRKYGNKRQVDGNKPHSIPHNFIELVIRAMKEAHCLIERECGGSYVEDALPSMSPDICIVNFYKTSGKLGLHQDRDESRESLQKGLPVVSFSVGDSAEFLYGDQRDVENAECTSRIRRFVDIWR